MKRKDLVKFRSKKSWYDYYVYLQYNYYFTLFGSLISKGCKIRAFDFLLKVRKEVKYRELNDWNLIFLVAMMNITPKISLFLLRMGGSNKKVPLPITEEKQISFAIKWLKILSKKDDRVISVLKMSDLICLALYNKGEAVQKKLDTHSLAFESRYLIKYFK